MRSIALALIVSFIALGSGDVFAQPSNESDSWRQVAEAIPLGSKVKLQTVENQRISGTLMRVDGTSVMVKKNTRRPEPAITVHFDDIAKIERDHGGGGINIAKAAAIGLATGAGVVVSLILFAMQFD